MLSLIKRAQTWYHRSVTVCRADPNFNVALVRIDPSDGSDATEVLLSAHNTKSVCWVIDQMMVESAGKITNCVLTLRIPQRGDEDEITVIKVPDWARKSLQRKLKSFCFQELNWDGRNPGAPRDRSAYR